MTSIMLNHDQEQAFEGLQDFISRSTVDTFILKGYAGTGKTFLMQYLAKWLKSTDQDFKLLASTGRAAAVLRGKTGFEAKTVHGVVYKFNRVNGDYDDIPDDAPIDKFGQMTLQFVLKPPEPKPTVYIVDEASMLSSEITDKGNFAVFGSGMVLLDFFEHIGKNKVIFVGDPCQLPPVVQVFSPALEHDWLKEHERMPVEFTLNKIERTRADNDLLKLAHKIRDFSLIQHTTKYPKLPAKGLEMVITYKTEVELQIAYQKCVNENGSLNTLAIAQSNKKVREINDETRFTKYNERQRPIEVGETLLVTQNNFAIPVTNGDFVVVTELGETKQKGDLIFQKVKIKTLITEQEYEILLSLNILYDSTNGNFTKDQNKFLMVEFSKKMRNDGNKPNDDEYKKEMMEDPFLNCLKANYGYAVTCHKSQGGEWDDVFLFLGKSMYGMGLDNMFKWWYTAITRAKKHIHLTNDWWISNFNPE